MTHLLPYPGHELFAKNIVRADNCDLLDADDTRSTIHVQQELVNRGFIVARRPGANVLRLDPALTVGSEDIVAFLTVLEEVLSAAPVFAPLTLECDIGELP